MQDFNFCMKTENNLDDEGSLPWFSTMLNFDWASKDPSKIKKQVSVESMIVEIMSHLKYCIIVHIWNQLLLAFSLENLLWPYSNRQSRGFIAFSLDNLLTLRRSRGHGFCTARLKLKLIYWKNVKIILDLPGMKYCKLKIFNSWQKNIVFD